MAIALLKYTFQFDPAEAWTSLSQFEEYLNKQLDAIGLSSNITATAAGIADVVVRGWLE